MKNLFLLFLVLAPVFCQNVTLEVSLEESSGTILSFLEKRYSIGTVSSVSDAGEPLILTKYIEEGKLDEAREAASVDSDYLLPNMDSYAGYLTVNKEYNANTWFWYFPVADKPVKDTPLIIWLQGGPGASCLYGLFTEIGPFAFNNDTNVLQEIQYSWGRNHSLLFFDNPVGTGFSFTDDKRGFATNQTTIGENLYEALQQFMTIFSELRTAPLIIAGESYAGKHIPSLAIQIHNNKETDKPINLRGLAIGNGFIDPKTLQRYSYFVREAGLVSDTVADTMKQIETIVKQSLVNGDTQMAFEYYNALVNLFLTKSNLTNLYNFLDDEIGISKAYGQYIQRTEIRKALHVGNTNFTAMGVVYKKLIPDFMNSAKNWLEKLIPNYRVMCYSGHLDIVVAYHPSVNTYEALRYPGYEAYPTATRKSWYHNKKLAGYFKTVGNFTEVMVRGAGHLVPYDKPAAALGMISAFARGITLDVDTGTLVDDNATSRSRQLP